MIPPQFVFMWLSLAPSAFNLTQPTGSASHFMKLKILWGIKLMFIAVFACSYSWIKLLMWLIMHGGLLKLPSRVSLLCYIQMTWQTVAQKVVQSFSVFYPKLKFMLEEIQSFKLPAKKLNCLLVVTTAIQSAIACGQSWRTCRVFSSILLQKEHIALPRPALYFLLLVSNLSWWRIQTKHQIHFVAWIKCLSKACYLYFPHSHQATYTWLQHWNAFILPNTNSNIGVCIDRRWHDGSNAL